MQQSEALQPPGVRRWVRVGAGLGLAVLALIVGATWALSYAPFGSPDDDYHLGSIWCAWGEADGLCKKVGNDGTQWVVETPNLVGLMEDCWVTQNEESAACSGSDPRIATRADDGQYPPGFYLVMRAFVGDSGIRSILTIRGVAFVCAAVLILGAIMLFPRHERARLVLVSLVALGPLGLFIMASVNPSSWSIAGLYAGFVATYAMLRATSRGPAFLACAVAALGFFVAAMSRADGSYYAIILAGAAGLASLPLRRERIRAVLPSAVVLAVVLLALFFTRGLFASSGMLSNSSADLGRIFAFSRISELPDLYFGAFAQSTGWLEAYVPAMGHVPRTLALGALLLLGLSRMQWPRALGLLLLSAFAVMLPLVLLAPQDLHVGVYVQPRYLLPILLAAVALLTFRRGGTPLRLSRSQAVALALLASVANSLTLHATIRRFVSGNEVKKLDLRIGADWWWNLPLGLGPNAIWLLGSAAFLALAVAVALMVDRDAGPRAEPAPSDDPPVPVPAPAPSVAAGDMEGTAARLHRDPGTWG